MTHLEEKILAHELRVRPDGFTRDEGVITLVDAFDSLRRTIIDRGEFTEPLLIIYIALVGWAARRGISLSDAANDYLNREGNGNGS